MFEVSGTYIRWIDLAWATSNKYRGTLSSSSSGSCSSFYRRFHIEILCTFWSRRGRVHSIRSEELDSNLNIGIEHRPTWFPLPMNLRTLVDEDSNVERNPKRKTRSHRVRLGPAKAVCVCVCGCVFHAYAHVKLLLKVVVRVLVWHCCSVRSPRWIITFHSFICCENIFSFPTLNYLRRYFFKIRPQRARSTLVHF